MVLMQRVCSQRDSPVAVDYIIDVLDPGLGLASLLFIEVQRHHRV